MSGYPSSYPSSTYLQDAQGDDDWSNFDDGDVSQYERSYTEAISNDDSDESIRLAQPYYSQTSDAEPELEPGSKRRPTAVTMFVNARRRKSAHAGKPRSAREALLRWAEKGGDKAISVDDALAWTADLKACRINLHGRPTNESYAAHAHKYMPDVEPLPLSEIEPSGALRSGSTDHKDVPKANATAAAAIAAALRARGRNLRTKGKASVVSRDSVGDASERTSEADKSERSNERLDLSVDEPLNDVDEEQRQLPSATPSKAVGAGAGAAGAGAGAGVGHSAIASGSGDSSVTSGHRHPRVPALVPLQPGKCMLWKSPSIQPAGEKSDGNVDDNGDYDLYLKKWISCKQLMEWAVTIRRIADYMLQPLVHSSVARHNVGITDSFQMRGTSSGDVARAGGVASEMELSDIAFRGIVGEIRSLLRLIWTIGSARSDGWSTLPPHEDGRDIRDDLIAASQAIDPALSVRFLPGADLRAMSYLPAASINPRRRPCAMRATTSGNAAGDGVANDGVANDGVANDGVANDGVTEGDDGPYGTTFTVAVERYKDAVAEVTSSKRRQQRGARGVLPGEVPLGIVYSKTISEIDSDEDLMNHPLVVENSRMDKVDNGIESSTRERARTGKWSKAEEDRLRELYHEKKGSLPLIAASFPSRTMRAINTRLSRILRLNKFKVIGDGGVRPRGPRAPKKRLAASVASSVASGSVGGVGESSPRRSKRFCKTPARGDSGADGGADSDGDDSKDEGSESSFSP